jgi:hypothetical protein
MSCALRVRFSRLNLTYYWLFVATAEVFATMTTTVLMASTGIHVGIAASILLMVLAFCAPSSRWIARIIDGRKYNFSISGAVAVGMIAVPVATTFVRSMGYSVSAAAVFASTAIGYTLGEGVGRLAYISFGCDRSPGPQLIPRALRENVELRPK